VGVSCGDSRTSGVCTACAPATAAVLTEADTHLRLHVCQLLDILLAPRALLCVGGKVDAAAEQQKNSGMSCHGPCTHWIGAWCCPMRPCHAL
jgi:hypothetical protein